MARSRQAGVNPPHDLGNHRDFCCWDFPDPRAQERRPDENPGRPGGRSLFSSTPAQIFLGGAGIGGGFEHHQPTCPFARCGRDGFAGPGDVGDVRLAVCELSGVGTQIMDGFPPRGMPEKIGAGK